MAMDVLKSAAMTYQGSVSGAAKPARSMDLEKAQKTEKPKVETDKNGPEAEAVENDAAKLLKTGQPSKDNTKDKDDGLEGGHQTSKQLQEAVEKLKKNMMTNTEAVFGIHEGTNRVMIKIVDKETKDLIKEYPPEQTLDMIQKVWEMAGILVDERG